LKPLVSIIIPAYNRAAIITQTLHSIVSQTYANWEVIVVDDGSTDATLEVVANYKKIDSRFCYYIRPEHRPKGPSACRNYGVEKANGKFLIFLDSDDLLASHCLEGRVTRFQENLDCDFLIFQMERFQIQPDYSKEAKPFENDKNTVLESFINLNGQWPITGPIYKTIFFKNTIGFNNKLIVFEDLEVAIRSVVLASNFLIFDNIDCYYRNDENYRGKFNTLDVKTKMMEGFQCLILSISKLISENSEIQFKNKDIQSYLVSSYKKLFRFYVLENTEEFKGYNKRMINLLVSNRYIKNTEAFKFLFVNTILLPFARFRGMGVSRLIKFIYK